jgi:hypothetical protein
MVSRSSVALFVGMLMLAIGMGGALTGELPGRFGEGASRTNKPMQYWPTLAGYFLAGMGFIGYYLHLIGAFSK